MFKNNKTSQGFASSALLSVIGVLLILVSLWGIQHGFLYNTDWIILLIFVLLVETITLELTPIGYISLGLPIYLAVALGGLVSSDPLINVAHGTTLFIVAMFFRFSIGFVSSQSKTKSRLVFITANALRYGILLSIALGVQQLTLIEYNDTVIAPAAILGLQAVLCFLGYYWIEKSFISKTLINEESQENQGSWNNLSARIRWLLPTLGVLGVMGAACINYMPDTPALRSLAIIGITLPLFAYRVAISGHLDERVFEDQQELQTQLNKAEYQTNELKLNNQRLENQMERKTSELETVYDMAIALGSSTRLTETLNIVFTMIKRLHLPYQSFVIFLQQGKHFIPAMQDTPSVEQIPKLTPSDTSKSLIHQCLRSGRPKLEPNLQNQEGNKLLKDEHSMIFIPLSVNKETIGAFYLGSVRPDTHKQEHLDVLKMLAVFAAPSIKTSVLFESKEKDLRSERAIRASVEAKNQQLAGLQKMGQAIGATLEFESSLRVVTGSLQEMIPEAQSIIIFTKDSENEDNHSLKTEFALTPYADYVKNIQLRDDEGLLGKCLELNSTLLVQDTQAYDIQNVLAFERSVVIAPLTTRHDNHTEILGCLYLGASGENVFSEEHRSLVETVSYQTAMALKNARLYMQTQQMALTDGLTGLFTHRLFQVRLEDELEWSDRNNKPFCLVMVDTDNFKNYNDTLGHPEGDTLLKEIAILLKDKVRATDIVCRYGGDEFSLILRETDKEAAYRTCERIREAFQLRFGGNKVVVTASVGMACYPIDADSKKDLAKAADDALYMSKRNGRNRVTVSPNLEERRKRGDIQQEVIPRPGK